MISDLRLEKRKSRTNFGARDWAGGTPISEPTFTQVVNAHGGLLTLRTDLLSGQKFVLKNLKTGMARHRGVVRTEKLIDNELSVAFQFATPSPDFWPIISP
jgi:hypothetical protein